MGAAPITRTSAPTGSKIAFAGNCPLEGSHYPSAYTAHRTFRGHRVYVERGMLLASVFFPFDRAVTFPIVTSTTDFPSGTLAEAERASSKICVIHTVIISIPLAHGARLLVHLRELIRVQEGLASRC